MDALRLVQENIVALAVFGAIGSMFILFWTERNNEQRKCLDLVTAPNGKYSRTAIGQCFGILLAIFAPLYTTLQGELDATIFAASLLYLGGVEMYSIWMRQKQSHHDDALPEGSSSIKRTDTRETEVTKSPVPLKEPI